MNSPLSELLCQYCVILFCQVYKEPVDKWRNVNGKNALVSKSSNEIFAERIMTLTSSLKIIVIIGEGKQINLVLGEIT